jgi:hypothetical protein
VELALDTGVSVAAVGGDRAWRPPGAARDPVNRGSQLRRVRSGAELDVVVEDDAIGVVDDLGLVAELDRLTEAALRIGRASGSLRLTSRVADSGITPASRPWVWMTTRSARSKVVCRSLIARRNRPLRCPAARRSARLALRTTAAASRIAASAMPASSPVRRRTAVCASSLAAAVRSRSLLAIDRARRPAARRRSREPVRVAPPAALIRSTVRAIVPTALANDPESVG